MQANLLAEPLLKKDAMMREIQAVDQEFEGCFTADDVRAEFIMQSKVKEGSSLKKFAWGNSKSL